MGILDQLLEKRDLRTYLRVRRAQLRRDHEAALTLPKRKRGPALSLIRGRLRELDMLAKVLNENRFKRYSIANWGSVLEEEP